MRRKRCCVGYWRMAELRHFLCLSDIPADALRVILDKAKDLKPRRLATHDSSHVSPLAGKTLAMIFEKPSTRTRVSFEVAMRELGGHPLVLNSADMQLGRGETVADTARVLSRYVHAIMLRCHRHADLEELARHASVPVINALSDQTHPCQVMADVMTFEERVGPIAGARIAWVGDWNNMARSWATAAERFGFRFVAACPEALAPRAGLPHVTLTHDPAEAVAGADAVVTDSWVSMGDTDVERRRSVLAPYQVNAALMEKAAKHAVFLHCLPAHRGEEVTDEVMDGPRSAVWDEAENRLHVQKAVLLWCLNML